MTEYVGSFIKVFNGERIATLLQYKNADSADCTYIFYVANKDRSEVSYELFSVYVPNLQNIKGTFHTNHYEFNIVKGELAPYKEFSSIEELDKIISNHIEKNTRWHALIASLKSDSSVSVD